MTVRVTVTFPEKLDIQVKQFAAQAEINYSAAVRTLIGKAMGGDLGRLLANEKVLEVRRVVDQAVRGQTEAFIQSVQAELDGVFSTGRREEPEEPPPVNLTGRRQAKARRR